MFHHIRELFGARKHERTQLEDKQLYGKINS